jgi:hypothetical protein
MKYKAVLHLDGSAKGYGDVEILKEHDGITELAGWGKWNGYNIYDCTADLPDEVYAELDLQCREQD